MSNPSEDPSFTQVVFKCKDVMAARVALVAIACLCAFLGFLWIKRDGPSGGILFLLFSFSCIFISALLTFMDQSDVVIDDLGISRRIFGRTWQVMRWDNVKEIKIFLVKTAYEPKGVRAFAFYPVTEARNGSSPPRRVKLVFRETFLNMDELISMLNRYISQYRIEAWTTINGTKVSVSSL